MIYLQLGLFYDATHNVIGAISVTRFGDLLDFGQLF